MEMLRYPSYKPFSAQPMLVPFIVATSISNILSLKIHKSNLTLNAIEEELGQHEYPGRPKGDPLKADFVQGTSLLNSNNNRLGINESKLNSLILALRKMQEYNAKIVALSHHADILTGLEDVDNLVEHLLNYVSNLLYRNTSEQKRTQTHLTIIFNFMAQRDNLTNISLANDSKRIAAASKRDSTAMKTISILTMLFLPGTYIAALFAIPVFNWDADPGTSVVNYRFWYYWATTVPLTALVLLSWLLWDPVRQRALGVYRRVVPSEKDSSSPPEKRHHKRMMQSEHSL